MYVYYLLTYNPNTNYTILLCNKNPTPLYNIIMQLQPYNLLQKQIYFLFFFTRLLYKSKS